MLSDRITSEEIETQALSCGAGFPELNCLCGSAESGSDRGGDVHRAEALLAQLWPALRQQAAIENSEISAEIRSPTAVVTVEELIEQLLKIYPNTLTRHQKPETDGDLTPDDVATLRAKRGHSASSRIPSSWFEPEPEKEDITYLEGTTS